MISKKMETYSKREIKRAGKELALGNATKDVIKKVNYWRYLHLYPLKTIQQNIEKKLRQNNINSFETSQRLKRLPSIISKLKRRKEENKEMYLTQIQDIGGCRIVFDNYDTLEKAKKNLSSIKKHCYEKVDNYIDRPKEDGYRSIHFIYNYNSKSKYNGLKIELQIRTKLQHIWATSVETAGIITKTNIKYGKGDNRWKEFFQIVSSLFAIQENLPILDIHKNISNDILMEKCYNLIKDLNVEEVLKTVKITQNHIAKKGIKEGYCLLDIDFIDKRIVIYSFKAKDRDKANIKYSEIESKNSDKDKKSVVLVSVKTFNDLKKAYPSYFLDTSDFISELKKIQKIYESILKEKQKSNSLLNKIRYWIKSILKK